MINTHEAIKEINNLDAGFGNDFKEMTGQDYYHARQDINQMINKYDHDNPEARGLASLEQSFDNYFAAEKKQATSQKSLGYLYWLLTQYSTTVLFGQENKLLA